MGVGSEDEVGAGWGGVGGDGVTLLAGGGGVADAEMTVPDGLAAAT